MSLTTPINYTLKWAYYQYYITIELITITISHLTKNLHINASALDLIAKCLVHQHGLYPTLCALWTQLHMMGNSKSHIFKTMTQQSSQVCFIILLPSPLAPNLPPLPVPYFFARGWVNHSREGQVQGRAFRRMIISFKQVQRGKRIETYIDLHKLHGNSSGTLDFVARWYFLNMYLCYLFFGLFSIFNSKANLCLLVRA